MVKESSNRVHEFAKNEWLELYLPTSKSINCPQEDGPEDSFYLRGKKSSQERIRTLRICGGGVYGET